VGDDYLLLVPSDPYHHPPEAARERAVGVLRDLAGDIWIDVWSKAEVTVFGEVEAVRHVGCPECGAELALAWWRAALAAAYRDDMFWPRLDITLPCCGRPARLDRLAYQPECLFGGFALFVSGGALRGPLDVEQLARVVAALGCPLRQSWCAKANAGSGAAPDPAGM
jgi:hypothetical protein